MAIDIEVIKPRQSNYDTYFLPNEVRDIKRNTPLYRLVSFWCMRKGRFICRDDIAAAFGISLRQASGIISSICRKTDEIKLIIKRIKASKGNVIKSYINIIEVLNIPKKTRSKPKSSNLPRKVKEKLNQEKGKALWLKLISGRIPA